MPTATIDEQGTRIYFVDTGSVFGSGNYTTLIMYHGTGFNSATFKKLIPLAPNKNMRLVLVNRRNYRGSTPYSNTDLENIALGRKAILEQMALDASGFLNWFLDHHDLPRMSKDGKSGGICLLGWSMGTATTLAFLGQPDLVGKQTYARLEPYLRRLVNYDSPSHALGFGFPPQAYLPVLGLTERDTSEELNAFPYWVGTHYTHPGDIATNDFLALDSQSQRGVRPHTETLSEAELEDMIEPGSARNDIGIAFYGDILIYLQEQANKALFDEYYAKTILPRLKVIHFVCLETLWVPLHALMQVRKRRERLIKEGKVIRPYGIVELPNESHFAHWEAPEKFFSKLVEALAI
ncbi:alpha/beta-hydrolase [Pluteus cervinus]|uniref:Alpha/beta-hydrolase n=1 Tax=Pluteus cervinus TaxID=181527 RepID=A0ACD3B595_9AGAR|nr:alpha/beta-hydrolase [Pluteus cervinus]